MGLIGRGLSVARVSPRRFTLSNPDALANEGAPEMELLSAGRQHDADLLLPDLLLSINAIASGLRTTG